MSAVNIADNKFISIEFIIPLPVLKLYLLNSSLKILTEQKYKPFCIKPPNIEEEIPLNKTLIPSLFTISKQYLKISIFS